MNRHKISDRQWEVFAPYLERKNKSKAGRPQKMNNRQAFEGVLWILGTGVPWRDLPTRFGAWQTVYRTANGQNQRFLKSFYKRLAQNEMTILLPLIVVLLKSTNMVQRQLVGKKKESIGKSRGGITTKIHAITDSLGMPLKILLTAGNVHDSKPALELLEACTSQALLADKAYGSSKILCTLQEKKH